MTLFDALREDHDIQRLLLQQLVSTSGDSKACRVVFDQLKAQLTAHARAEEQQLYVPMIQNGTATMRARHGIAEHHEIERLVQKLENTDMSSSGWLATANLLKSRVEHHLQEEEQELVQIAGRLLSEKETHNRGAKYKNEMNAALPN